MSQQTPSLEPTIRPTASVDVCVPMLQRTDALERLLQSTPLWVDTVHVADNGHPEADRGGLYDREYAFDLDVIDLDHDVGIGRCRQAAAAASDADYIVACDNDMELPWNLDVLMTILEADPYLAGVGGILEEHGQLRSGCCNFRDAKWWGGEALVQEIGSEPPVERVAGHPIARFNKLANAMVVRREALDDYTWDDAMADREHLDFFVGMWQETDWEFAVCPEVVFRHHPGGPDEYVTEYRYENEARQQATLNAFKEKWDYERVVLGDTRWFGTGRRPLAEHAANRLTATLPLRYTLPIKDFGRRLFQ